MQRNGLLALELQRMSFSIRIVSQKLWLGSPSPGTLALELWLRHSSLGAATQKRQLEIFSLEALAQELLLKSFSLDTLALEPCLRTLALDLQLRSFGVIAFGSRLQLMNISFSLGAIRLELWGQRQRRSLKMINHYQPSLSGGWPAASRFEYLSKVVPPFQSLIIKAHILSQS